MVRVFSCTIDAVRSPCHVTHGVCHLPWHLCHSKLCLCCCPFDAHLESLKPSGAFYGSWGASSRSHSQLPQRGLPELTVLSYLSLFFLGWCQNMNSHSFMLSGNHLLFHLLLWPAQPARLLKNIFPTGSCKLRDVAEHLLQCPQTDHECCKAQNHAALVEGWFSQNPQRGLSNDGVAEFHMFSNCLVLTRLQVPIPKEGIIESPSWGRMMTSGANKSNSGCVLWAEMAMPSHLSGIQVCCTGEKPEQNFYLECSF